MGGLVTVKFAGKILKENEDYSVRYLYNNARGIGSIEISTVANSNNFRVESAYGDSSIYLEYVIK